MDRHVKYCQYCGGSTDKYLSVETVAALLDCSTDFIRDQIKEGRIDCVILKSPRRGATRKPIRIPANEIHKIIERRRGIDSMVQDTLLESA
ncbi:helix-turn-helix domain-containing protein [Candidatus Neomarinimicrobiota bacterium]